MSTNYHILYRHFAVDNKLLYVGITNNIHGRISQHKLVSKWFLDITNITLQHFPSRSLLIKAEIEAIKTENPEYNVINKVTKIEEERIKKKHILQQHENSKNDLIIRTVKFKPMYCLTEASRLLDIPDVRIKNLIRENKIGHVILGYRASYPKYGITGWQMLEFIEHLESSGDSIKQLYGRL